jgi:hypothetical protein
MLRDVAKCGPVEPYRRCGGTYSFQPQGRCWMSSIKELEKIVCEGNTILWTISTLLGDNSDMQYHTLKAN